MRVVHQLPGTPREGDLSDNAGSIRAKIMRCRPRNGLTGAMGDTTEVCPGVHEAVFRKCFRRHYIQRKVLRACARIDTPIKMKDFPKRDRLTNPSTAQDRSNP